MNDRWRDIFEATPTTARSDGELDLARVSVGRMAFLQRGTGKIRVFLAGVAWCATCGLAAPPRDLQLRVDSWAAGRAGGVAVAWVDGDGETFATAGHSDAEGARQVTADTPFALGSVTKVFTAILFAEAERRGIVRRDDPAATFLLPGTEPRPAGLSRITLLSLVTHRAGLPTSPANFPAFAKDPQNPFAAYHRAALIEALQEHGAQAPVGRAVVYSNFGFAILGEALGAAWGGGYPEALSRAVLQRLGMRSTKLLLAGSPSPHHLAEAHADGRTVRNWTFSAFASAGGLSSTARDMSRLLAACVSDEPNPLRGAIDTMFVVQADAPDFDCKMALGWFIEQRDGQHLAWHAGATTGSRAFVAIDLRRRTSVAILSNADREVSEFAFALLNAPRRALTARTLPIQGAAEYVGHYILPNGRRVAVSEQKGVLFAREESWDFPLALRHLADDRFAVTDVPAEVRFARTAHGRIAAIETDIDGHWLRAPREPASER